MFKNRNKYGKPTKKNHLPRWYHLDDTDETEGINEIPTS